MPIYDDIACPACGCVCDDLRVAVEDETIVRVDGGCAKARAWFLQQNDAREPIAEIDGREASLEDAVKRAAELLSAAKSPLMWGLSRSSTPGQREAVALADAIGATIDPATAPSHSPSLLAMQQVGMSTATLGEIRQRAALVVFWGVDPVTTHPRFLERFIDPPGRFVPGGREERTLVVIDQEATATSNAADHFIPLRPGTEFEAIATLRLLLRGSSAPPGGVSDMSNARWADLIERMKTCRTGVVIFAFASLPSHAAQHAAEALLRLVQELNAHARFYALPMPAGGLAGAENVLAWQTGFPGAVNLSRGWPRYSPGEYSAETLLGRSEADACLLVGSEGVARLSAAARARLDSIATIVLDHPAAMSTLSPTVRFTTAVYGIHLPGTAYRMDDVPLPLRAVLPPKYPSDAEVLKRIQHCIESAVEGRGG